MTEPLVPSDVDLRDFHFMPLDVVRLRDSDLSGAATAEEFRCAVLLWCASWHQLPAASLPDDDAVMANLAGFGRSIKEWRKHKTGAMRGWIKCDDGRLYHPVVAEKAIEAWHKRKVAIGKGKAGASARWNNKQNLTNGTSITTATATSNGTGISQAMPGDGNRQGQGQGQGRDKERKQDARAREISYCRTGIVEAFENANSPNPIDTSRVEMWEAQGYDLRICLAVVTAGAKRKPSISTLNYFDNQIKEAHQNRAPSSAAMNGHAIESEADRQNRFRSMWDYWKRNNDWPFSGPNPDCSGCQIPKEMIEQWARA